MGGRITVESVVRCSWNGWPDDRGIRSDYLTVAESVLRKGVRHFATYPQGCYELD
jgi:hypothetical protein